VKLDKRHLIAAVTLLVGSIIYNVWVFTRPASGTSPAGAPVATFAAAPAPSGGAAAASAPLDPAKVKPLPDVELDRLPDWPRNPFANLRPQEPAVVDAVAPERPSAVPKADPVVATILYSTDRRLAMVDGRIVRVGDRLGDATIVDIVPNAVIIESPDRGRRSLTLRPPGTGVIAQ
jgi:hypothetical protein